MGEHLLCKQEAQSSNPVPQKKKKKKQQQQLGLEMWLKW
jgi:hypothetical protein